MPTLADIANQVNDTLSQINGNTAAVASTAAQIKGDTAAIKVELAHVHATLQGGIRVLAGGLHAIHEAQKHGNSLLAAIVAQNQTVICLLETSARTLCAIARTADEQLAVNKVARDAAVRTRRILERVHARETLDVEQAEALDRKIEQCCPPKPQTPRDCMPACPPPRYEIYPPKGQDWQPPRGGPGQPDDETHAGAPA